MTYHEFKMSVAAAATAQGLEKYDLYYVGGSTTHVAAFDGEIDAFSESSSFGAGFRCIVDGRMGYANTQLLDEAEAYSLVRDAKAWAQAIEATGFTRIYEGSQFYSELPQAADEGCDTEALKVLAVSMEEKAKAIDPRVETSPVFSLIQHTLREVALANSYGLDLHNRQAECIASYQAIIAEGGRKYIGSAYRQALSLEGLDIDSLVAEAVGLAASAIGATSVPTGRWPVIFSPEMMAALLGCFIGTFSADAAQKGISLLAGKEGEMIASPLVSLVDDPHFADSARKTPFDDEGVATYIKTIIDKGELKTLLYDLQSAAKAGKSSTGNGRRAGFASDVTVSPFVLCIQPGLESQEILFANAGKAIYITEIKGTHAGSNPVTGDFSLESKGFVVEDGKIVRPAEQFTVAGNFFSLLKDITGIAEDFELHDGIGAPSVLVRELSIAGGK